MTISFNLPKWYDLHAHFRQDDLLPLMVQEHIQMGCAGILGMPNTKPPVGKVFENDPLDFWSIETYLNSLKNAANGALDQIIVPLYLTENTTVQMIEEGAKSGLLRACKYYPPHGTTGAEHSITFQHFINNGVLETMQNHNIILCVHGEEHNLSPEDYFDDDTNAEERFYQNILPPVIEKFPQLRIIAEHLTTKTAVELVEKTENMAATVTPQHLLYTIGHLLQGLKYHLYCLPLIKFDKDRQALRDAVTNPQNKKFFAGTDSAPHTKKATDCGCAAGYYTGAIAPALYIEAFEECGLDMAQEENQNIFKKFLCLNGPEFYGFPASQQSFTLKKEPQTVKALKTNSGDIIPLPLGMSPSNNTEQPVTLNWSIQDI